MNAAPMPVPAAVPGTAAQVSTRAPAAHADSAEFGAFIDAAVARLEEHGFLCIEGAISRNAVDTVHRYFHTAYDSYMRPRQRQLFRNFQDDPRRAQIPIAPEGAVANPEIYANRFVMGVIGKVLGTDAVIGEMGGVISHPGALPQYTHRDSNWLYGGTAAEFSIPLHSLTVLIPLLDVPLEMGPTEYWPGSHRMTAVAEGIAPERLPLSAGSVLIWSPRLLHRGGANQSSTVRPAIYINYQRPWFIERSGYDTKPQIRVTQRMMRAIPESYQRLFSWALHLNRSDSLDEFLMRWVGRVRSRLLR